MPRGNVIESGVEPGGPTATVLVRKGTLHLGDIILCGEFYGRVRALINEEGQRLRKPGRPSPCACSVERRAGRGPGIHRGRE